MHKTEKRCYTVTLTLVYDLTVINHFGANSFQHLMLLSYLFFEFM